MKHTITPKSNPEINLTVCYKYYIILRNNNDLERLKAKHFFLIIKRRNLKVLLKVGVLSVVVYNEKSFRI